MPVAQARLFQPCGGDRLVTGSADMSASSAYPVEFAQFGASMMDPAHIGLHAQSEGLAIAAVATPQQQQKRRQQQLTLHHVARNYPMAPQKCKVRSKHRSSREMPATTRQMKANQMLSWCPPSSFLPSACAWLEFLGLD